MKTATKPAKKVKVSKEETALLLQKENIKRIKLYPPTTWKAIETWGRESENLSQHLQSNCFTISGRVRTNTNFEGLEVANGIRIIEIVAEKAPELLIEVEKTFDINYQPKANVVINLELVKQLVNWDKKNKKLKTISFTFMNDLATEKKQLTDQNKKIASWNLEIVQKYGFVYKPAVEKVEPETTESEDDKEEEK